MKKILSMLLVFAMALTCCFGAAASAEADKVVVGITIDPGNIGPFQGMSAGRIGILFTTYEFLVTKVNGERVNCLAKEITQVDEKTVDVEIYDYIVDQAGNPLTAADVVYSLELARKSDLYAVRLACVDTITQASQNQVVLTLRQAMGSLPLLLDVPVIRADSVQSPLGTGPYVLIQTADGACLERVSGWRGGDAPIGRICLHAVDNTDSVRDAFEFGRISLVVSDLNTVGAVNFHSNYELWSQDTPVMQFLSFNSESPLFQSAAVRAAVTHAIDRQGLITEYFDGYGVAATLPMQPRCPSYFASLADDYGPREGALAGAVAEAGLTGRRGTLLVNSDNATNAAAAEAIAASLREGGLEIEVLTAAGSNYDSLVELGGYDLLYCEVRLTADFDLSAFFGGALSDYAIQHNDAPALCAAAMENSGNFYDLHRLIMDEGLLCPILFKTRAVMTDRGSVSGLTPAPVNVFYQLDRLIILTGGAKEESQ